MNEVHERVAARAAANEINEEVDLLEQLRKEPDSLFAWYCGDALNRLILKGLVQVNGTGPETSVSPTPRGRLVIEKIGVVRF